MSMLREYVSKSSMENFKNCGMSYLLSYPLGYRSPPRKRTVLGTAVHSIFEILAKIKMKIQEGEKIGGIEHDELGIISWDIDSYYTPTMLTDEEVDKINKSSTAPKNEAATQKNVEGQPKDKSTSGADQSKADDGKKAADSPSGYSRGEGQKPTSKAYKDNWNAIFAKKKKR